jgi:hypothetical protein
MTGDVHVAGLQSTESSAATGGRAVSVTVTNAADSHMVVLSVAVVLIAYLPVSVL